MLYHRGKRKGYGSVLAICGSSRKRSGLSYNFSMEPVPQIVEMDGFTGLKLASPD